MKMEKKYFLCIVICFCAGIVFSGCNKDNDGTGTSSIKSIVAQVVHGANFNSEIDVVKAVMYYGEDEKEYVVAEGEYKNGGFTIILPETVDNKYLQSDGEVDIEYVGEGVPDGIKVSDPTVRMGVIDLEGYKSDEYIDDFIYAKFQISEKKITLSAGGFCYVDKDVKITGSVSEKDEEGYKMTVSCNMFLKQGWNIMYVSLVFIENEMIISATTKDPGGMKWYYSGDDDLDFLDIISTQFQPKTVSTFSMKSSKLFSPIKFLEVK